MIAIICEQDFCIVVNRFVRVSFFKSIRIQGLIKIPVGAVVVLLAVAPRIRPRREVEVLDNVVLLVFHIRWYDSTI